MARSLGVAVMSNPATARKPRILFDFICVSLKAQTAAGIIGEISLYKIITLCPC
jgi:hypothetical protein